MVGRSIYADLVGSPFAKKRTDQYHVQRQLCSLTARSGRDRALGQGWDERNETGKRILYSRPLAPGAVLSDVEKYSDLPQ